MYSVRQRALSSTAYVVHPHPVPSADNFDNARGIGPLTPVLIVSTAANPLPHLTPYQPLSSLLLRTEYGVHTFRAFRIPVWLDTSQRFPCSSSVSILLTQFYPRYAIGSYPIQRLKGFRSENLLRQRCFRCFITSCICLLTAARSSRRGIGIGISSVKVLPVHANGPLDYEILSVRTRVKGTY